MCVCVCVCVHDRTSNARITSHLNVTLIRN